MKPSGIALTRERIYFTDLRGGCVRVYDKRTRAPLFIFPRDAGDEKAKLFSPTNLTIDDQGRVYVSDTGGFAFHVYDAEGNHLRATGELGIEPGRFNLPKGIGVDRAGRVYVVDAATAVVQLFDAEGRLLMYFGAPASSGSAGLYLPAGLAIDYANVGLYQKFAAPGYTLDYLIFVTNQIGSKKVSVYGFLKKS